MPILDDDDVEQYARDYLEMHGEGECSDSCDRCALAINNVLDFDPASQDTFTLVPDSLIERNHDDSGHPGPVMGCPIFPCSF